MSVGYLSTAVLDEQEAVRRIKDFLITSIGWSVSEEISNTASDVDIVFSSPGEADVQNQFQRFIRIRGTGNYVYLYTYDTFISSMSYTGELEDSSYGRVVVPSDSQGCFIRVVADLERVVVSTTSYNGTTYIGYVGRITSYYYDYQHPYPNIVKGCDNALYDWYYSAGSTNSWMFGPEGTKAHYYAVEPVGFSGLSAGKVSDRNGEVFMSAPVLVRDDADQNKSELVGEPRGIYRVVAGPSLHGSFLSLGEDIYVVFSSNNKSWVVGPVTVSGVGAPRLFTDLT